MPQVRKSPTPISVTIGHSVTGKLYWSVVADDVNTALESYRHIRDELTRPQKTKRKHDQRTYYEVMVDILASMTTPPTTTELSDLFPFSKEKRSSLLISAERDGLIERRHSPGTPGTTKLVYLTDAGQALHARQR